MASGLCAALTGRTHGCTDQPASVKKTLANSEPSTHGTKRTYRDDLLLVRFRVSRKHTVDSSHAAKQFVP